MSFLTKTLIEASNNNIKKVLGRNVAAITSNEEITGGINTAIPRNLPNPFKPTFTSITSDEEITGLAPTGSNISFDEPPEIDVAASRLGRTLDHRFRLSALDGQEIKVYGKKDRDSNLLAVLHDTGGLLFPYTPSISFNQPVSWQSLELTQTNFDILSYNRTPSPTIGLTGKFTCQNAAEARYSLAVIHFMRVLSKGGFGSQDAEKGVAGLPPRVVRLNGYGKHMFNDLRCVIRGHSWSFDENTDTVKIPFAGEYASLPMVFSITFELGVQMSPKTQREKYSSEEFRTSALNANNNFGFI